MKDCAQIFDEKFDDADLDQIKQKFEYSDGEDEMTVNRSYYLWSCQVLRCGIPGIKFNYSN